MARTKSNLVLQGLKGGLDKQLVVKQYSYGIVVTKYPDMEGIVPSALQQLNQSKFKMANAYAKAIVRDPVAKAAWKAKIPEGKAVYNAAIQEYMANH